MGLTRNQLTGQLVRGFESLLLRHEDLLGGMRTKGFDEESAANEDGAWEV